MDNCADVNKLNSPFKLTGKENYGQYIFVEPKMFSLKYLWVDKLPLTIK